MIELKTSVELAKMIKACQLSAGTLKRAREVIAPGISTKELNDELHEYILSRGGKPSFLGYGGFPGSACISINEEVIHGIPKKERILKEGDMVSVDVGATIEGYHGDNAYTFAVGKIKEEDEKLRRVTKNSLKEAIKVAVEGNRIGDISNAVQSYVEKEGFTVIREFVGHGIGRALHEPPEVPNFGMPGRGPRLVKGMTLAIEPMVNAGSCKIKILPDKWTVVTEDGKKSAHFEHTILITGGEAEILTRV